MVIEIQHERVRNEDSFSSTELDKLKEQHLKEEGATQESKNGSPTIPMNYANRSSPRKEPLVSMEDVS